MDNLDPNTIKALADAVPQSTKEKLFNPTADAIGQGVGGIFTWIFRKPIEFGIIKKAEFADLANKTAEKLKTIPEENRDDDKFGLTIKTLEQSKYSINDEMLRSWFSTLVANSVDNRVNGQLSPYFPTILGNLSHNDAVFLSHFNRSASAYPYYSLRMQDSSGRGYDLVTGLTNWNWEYSATPELEMIPEKANALAAFGLLEIDSFGGLSSEYADKSLANIETEKEALIQKYSAPNIFSFSKSQGFTDIKVKNNSMKITALGQLFIDTVIPK